MNDTNDWFGYDSLAFFGRVNASISHELKNVMAIISETAGLLSDLSDMASSETPIAPDILKDCTGSIVEEIQRGFAVIRQMNRFSHSIDNPAEPVNLLEVLDLAINLSGYLSFAGRADVRPLNGMTPVVVTCPFLLQAIVYQTLVYTFKNTGPGAEIYISIKTLGDDEGWKIIFSGFSVSGFQVFPDALIKSMAASINVTISCDRTADWLELVVPSAIETGAPLDG
jgi:signal transduction histidine kinase